MKCVNSRPPEMHLATRAHCWKRSRADSSHLALFASHATLQASSNTNPILGFSGAAITVRGCLRLMSYVGDAQQRPSFPSPAAKFNLAVW